MTSVANDRRSESVGICCPNGGEPGAGSYQVDCTPCHGIRFSDLSMFGTKIIKSVLMSVKVEEEHRDRHHLFLFQRSYNVTVHGL